MTGFKRDAGGMLGKKKDLAQTRSYEHEIARLMKVQAILRNLTCPKNSKSANLLQAPISIKINVNGGCRV